MMTISRTLIGGKLRPRYLALVACLLFLIAGPVMAVTIEVTEVNGTVQALRQGASIRIPVTVGTILFTCDRIFVQPNSSMKWKRRGTDCDNTGGTLNSDASHGMAYHVGAESVGPGAPSRLHSLASPLAGGFIDLETSEEAFMSQVTIEEGAACSGVNHCGLSSAIAQAAAIDATSPGAVTAFTGCLSYNELGLPSVSFWSNPANHIQIMTTPLVGPSMGQLIPLAPGENIIYDSNGNSVRGSGPLPCTGAEPPTASFSSTWGRVKAYYR
ncbi:MAG: hypothetical protein A2W29_10550 [Gemmatimonadetes bacterium RBG_16_66_8]|nr:MAG: hypothetical protein A2W29_10550 [Gemmatimonadetes bacterium RBG_16_66_8]